ncbi:hypothetical protein AWZ03_009374 [Drosophila navojoa]|uniref:Uncharacterized protein n=1 Tax=Drosophila navojoa TaxID=7232 RepID=A0A484B810_DRONA|nr:hypothetical protein AWZ03_009374 [Drosophila navojoa]
MPRHHYRRRRRNRDLHFNIDRGLLKTQILDAERPLTTKFYARHDHSYYHCDDETLEKMREKYHRKLLPEMNAKVNGNVVATPSSQSASQPVPRHVSTQPMTENQMYGWYQHRAFDFLCRLIVSQMSVTRCEAWHWQAPMFVMSLLMSLWLPVLERPLLYILLIVTTLTHWHYGASVVNQMCEHFNRVCFTVHKRVTHLDVNQQQEQKTLQEQPEEQPRTVKQD